MPRAFTLLKTGIIPIIKNRIRFILQIIYTDIHRYQTSKSFIMNCSKKCIATFVLLNCMLCAFSQKQDSSLRARNNVLKINLSALAVKNISVQYEIKVGKRTSFTANAHVLPFGQLPFANTINDAIDDPNIKFNEFKLGNTGFTAEFRYYVGKKGALHGFYIAPFINSNTYKADLPLSYSNDTKTGIFSGKINALTGGIQFGSEMSLGKRFVLDWWIVGPNYGQGKGDFSLATALSPTEQDEVRSELANLKDDNVIGKVIKSYDVSSKGATVIAKGPWVGLRAFGINLGFRF